MTSVYINGVDNLIEELSKRTGTNRREFRANTGRLVPSITNEPSYTVEYRTIEKPIPPGEMIIDAEYAVSNKTAFP